MDVRVGRAFGLIVLVWRDRPLRASGLAAQTLGRQVESVSHCVPLSEEERKVLKPPLFIAPVRWRRW